MAPFFTASTFVVIGTDRDRKLSEVTLPINKVERRDRHHRQDRATNRAAAGGASRGCSDRVRMPLCSWLHRVELPCAGFASLRWPLPCWLCCLSRSEAIERRRSFPAECSMESFNVGQVREAPHTGRTPFRARDQAPKRRRKARRMAPGRARQPLRQVRMARPRRLFSQASIHALPATGFSPLRTHQVGIASRRREPLRRLIWAASTAWWARHQTATARRIQSCWAATAFTTPRPAVTAWPSIPPLKHARGPRKSSPAKCAKTG
jgi:hypothetical protein